MYMVSQVILLGIFLHNDVLYWSVHFNGKLSKECLLSIIELVLGIYGDC